MQKAIRFTAIVVAMGALVGCGGAKIGSKEEAAHVAFAAGSKGSATKGGLARLYQSADSTGSFTVDCTHGGTASSSVEINTGNSNALFTLKVTYDRCVEPSYDDPQTETVENEDVTYDGSVTLALTTDFTANSFSAGMTMKGRIDLSGAISDFVDMDVTETIDFSGGQNSVSGKTTINGTIKTSSESYVYDNETYEISAEGKVTKVASNP